MKTTCIKCGKEIEDQATTGRPKDYCSTGCRRAAEHEVRRINLRLEKLEEQLSNNRIGYGLPSEKISKNLKSEIAIYEERLRVLLENEKMSSKPQPGATLGAT